MRRWCDGAASPRAIGPLRHARARTPALLLSMRPATRASLSRVQRRTKSASASRVGAFAPTSLVSQTWIASAGTVRESASRTAAARPLPTSTATAVA
eukprot:scaffold54863_cov31-Tisochrysis_lutea.AAC.2